MAQGIKRFTNVKNLKGLGRKRLGKLFDKFKQEMGEIVLPKTDLEDDPYYQALKKVFLSQKELPSTMVEFLFAVGDMGNDPGQERLEKAVLEEGLKVEMPKRYTPLDYALEVGLLNEALLFDQWSEMKMVAVTSFRYFGTKIPKADRPKFTEPSDEVMELLKKQLDEKFSVKQRGENTVQISKHEMDGEWWFVIEHGGTLKQQPTAENGKREWLVFRPEQDDLVVYDVERDQIRIHASAGWERELYRTAFGQRLRGNPDHFSLKKNFTLEPLRVDIEKALDVESIPGVNSLKLVEIEVSYPGEFGDTVIHKSRDMVASATARSEATGKTIKPVPEKGQLVTATFELDVEGVKAPRRVHLRVPNGLRVARNCDARLIHKWLDDAGFRDAGENAAGPKRGMRPVMQIAAVSTAPGQPTANGNE